MRVGRLNFAVFSSALLCFGTICATQSGAAPQRPWYRTAFDRVLNLASNEGGAALGQANEADKQIASAYVSRIAKDNDTITFQGDAPSEADLKILQGVAAATSPGAAFADKGHLNVNVPDRDVWLAAMTFALRQLGKLDHGVAQLRNNAILIEGVTKSGDDFASVQRRLREEAPKGINLQLQAAVKPHWVHPFNWSAQLQPGSLLLSGHVPDQQDQSICNHAQNVFQTLRVNNNMEFAEGEPRNWTEAAKVALDMLGLLYAGNASLSDNVVKLEGIFSSPEMAALLKSYKERLPAGYRLEEHIVQPVARAPSADVNLAAHSTASSFNP